MNMTASSGPTGGGAPAMLKTVGTRTSALYWAIIGLLATIMLVLGLIVLSLNALTLGPVAFVVALVGAVLPVPIYLGLFLWLDRFEPEPPVLLILAFLWGATTCICIAGCMNDLLGMAFNSMVGNAETAHQMTASFSAPMMEETWKGLAVLMIFLFKREEFDGVLDGIIYAGVTALGFAMVENIQYYGGALQRGGLVALTVTYVLRGVMSPYTHVLFTSMTGIGFGLAASTRNLALKIILPVLGWMIAMFLHFLWNSLPALGGDEHGLLVLLVTYFIFWVPAFGILIGLVFWSLRRESKLITSELGYYVQAGELTGEEASMLARLWPRMCGMCVGPVANTPWGIRRKYTKCATMLAFYRHRLATGHSKANAEIEALHLAELRSYRGKS
jgi:protease PrsW